MTSTQETFTLGRDGYECVWSLGTDGFVNVTVYKDSDEALLEWQYPIIEEVMGKTLESAAGFWMAQAILEVKSAVRKRENAIEFPE